MHAFFISLRTHYHQSPLMISSLFLSTRRNLTNMKFSPKASATLFLPLFILITIASLSCSARHHKSDGGGGIPGAPPGGFFGPGGGFGIPGMGAGWPGSGGFGGGGYGAGYGGPTGGYSRGGVVRPTVVCKDKGPCYMQKLTCPAKCFTSFHRSGKGYGAGGGGGGCTIDCKKKCTAYC